MCMQDQQHHCQLQGPLPSLAGMKLLLLLLPYKAFITSDVNNA